MKKVNILYWIFTGLAAGLMLFSSIGDAMLDPKAIAFMNGVLHYPDYFTQFIGFTKILGVIGLLVPLGPRLKEWVYAGIIFDLAGAVYSQLAVAPNPMMLLMLIWILPVVLSYIYYHKRLKLKVQEARAL